MANIQKRTTKGGEVAYRVQIRIKGYPIETATFKRLAFFAFAICGLSLKRLKRPNHQSLQKPCMLVVCIFRLSVWVSEFVFSNGIVKRLFFRVEATYLVMNNSHIFSPFLLVFLFITNLTPDSLLPSK